MLIRHVSLSVWIFLMVFLFSISGFSVTFVRKFMNVSIFELVSSIRYKLACAYSEDSNLNHSEFTLGPGRTCNPLDLQSDCRSRGCKFYPSPVPYFPGDLSWNNFYGHFPPTSDSRRVAVSYERYYVHEVLVNCLIKLAQEKVWLGELTVSTWP